MITADQFISDILRNSYNKEVIQRLTSLELDDTWLVAGCLFQTVWNLKSSLSPEAGINDYDIFYYHPDTSWEAENREIKKAETVFSDLPVKIELRNQARVPIWYREKFGLTYPPVTCSKDNISRFFFRCNCVGLTVQHKQPEIYSPYGFDDIYAGILRPNHEVDSYITPGSRQAKADKYISRWPWLKIEN